MTDERHVERGGPRVGTSDGLSTVAVIILWLLVSLLLATAGLYVSSRATEPYMDEIFHVAQASTYCQGNLHVWNPMITTFPGLYLYTALGERVISSTVCPITRSLFDLIPDSVIAEISDLSTLVPLLLPAATCVTRLCSPSIGRDRLMGTIDGEEVTAGVFDALLMDTVGGPGDIHSIAYFPCSEVVFFRWLNTITFSFLSLYSIYHILSIVHRSQTTKIGGESAATRTHASGTTPPLATATATATGALAPRYLILETLLIVTFPISFFTLFLFYSDSGSVACILLCYLCALRGQFVWSGLVAFVAVLFRQNNVVWVAFVVGAITVNHVPGLRGDGESAANPLAHHLGVVCRFVLSRMYIHLMCMAAFMGFVWWNGSIVLGDKEQHSASFHLAQLAYFFSVVAFFLLPRFLFDHLPRLLSLCSHKNTRTRALLSFVVLELFFLATLHFFTYEHPYLLADNRHFPFYVWKLLRRHPPILYASSVVSALCAMCVWISFARCGTVWKVGYIICVTAVLVPSPLIEPRYFIIPVVVYMLHAQQWLGAPSSTSTSTWSMILLCAQLCWFAGINAATIYLFLFRPFTWPDGEVARFMW